MGYEQEHRDTRGSPVHGVRIHLNNAAFLAYDNYPPPDVWSAEAYQRNPYIYDEHQMRPQYPGILADLALFVIFVNISVQLQDHLRGQRGDLLETQKSKLT